VFKALGTEYEFSKLWVNRFDPHPGSEANQMAADFMLDELGAEFWDYPAATGNIGN
jgi:hypothetical protein